MKELLKISALLLAVVVCFRVGFALADGNNPTATPGTTPVAVVSTQAATTCVESTVAAGSATAVTVPAIAGQYFYITNISSSINAIAAPAATLYPTTSTNVPGSYSIRQAAQATVFNINQQEVFATPLKTSVVGTATTFSGTALANVSASLRVCGFYAP